MVDSVPAMRVCVFCGSAPGVRAEYEAATRALGTALGERGIGVVYGGASVGLMGTVADAALAAGGEVVGVIPQALVDREIAHPGLSALHVVGSMHERKARMAELSDVFVALPGGIGTLEELFEVWTWRHLGLHAKPIVLLDTAGFWTGLEAFLAHAEAEGFVKAAPLTVVPDVPALLQLL